MTGIAATIRSCGDRILNTVKYPAPTILLALARTEPEVARAAASYPINRVFSWVYREA